MEPFEGIPIIPNGTGLEFRGVGCRKTVAKGTPGLSHLTDQLADKSSQRRVLAGVGA